MQLDQLLGQKLTSSLFSGRTGIEAFFGYQNPNTNSNGKKNAKSSKRIKNVQNINITHLFSLYPAKNQAKYKYSITLANPLINTANISGADLAELKAGVIKAATNAALAISRKKSDNNPDIFASNLIRFNRSTSYAA